ncbi:CRISPR-associated endonuclease Cas2, partial [uncultured Actinomyces sp.]|uniref:CRISPR-associated endonuclease Cas2 n=1 Tax=uncultured Actinomyces sp. TaxID=249061 RepID=UPI0028058EFE
LARDARGYRRLAAAISHHNLTAGRRVEPAHRLPDLAAALEGWGYRIQESVFSLRLEDDELRQVRTCVDEIIDADDDVVHIYPLCAACLARGEVHGTAPDLDDGGLYRGVW